MTEPGRAEPGRADRGRSDAGRADPGSEGTRHLVHPHLAPLLEGYSALPVDDGYLAALRARNLRGNAALPPDADTTTREEFIPSVVAGDPAVRVLVTTPRGDSAAPRGAIMMIHGGGFISGAPEHKLPLARAWAAELDAVVVSVDYRLAPEHPHPAPAHDCFSVLIRLVERSDELRIDRRRIAVTGDSAGGGLAVAVALQARGAGIGIAAQVLLYPMLDDRTVTQRDPDPITGEFIWTRESNAFAWRALLAGEPGGTDVPELAAPARAADLSGLPPTLISVGTLDLFLDEDLAFARRLMRAGVPVEVQVLPGAYHGFAMVPASDAAVAHGTRALAALRRAVGLAD